MKKSFCNVDSDFHDHDKGIKQDSSLQVGEKKKKESQIHSCK